MEYYINNSVYGLYTVVVWHLVSIANSAVQFMVLLGIKSMRKLSTCIR